MASLVLEVGVEELPPPAVVSLESQLREVFFQALKTHRGFVKGESFFATPRRFGVVCEDFGLSEEGRYKRVRGPKAEIFYDEEGGLTRAGVGFLKKWGLKEDEVEVVDGYVWASVKNPADERAILSDFLRGLEKLSFPKMMRWSGGEEKPFVRPVRWLLALLGDSVVPLRCFGVTASNKTRGVRVHGSAEVEIGGYEEYLSFVEREGIVLRFEERLKRIEEGLRELGGDADFDRDLLRELAASVETFSVYRSNFSEEFSELPEEIVNVVLIRKGKVFPLRSGSGRKNEFLIVASVPKKDLTAVPEGYGKLANSRLSDVQFYMQKDDELTFEDMLDGLKKFAFLKGAGTLFDRVERLRGVCEEVGKEWLDERDLEFLEKLASLAKSDLSTHLVVEYTDLAGVVGRLYAKKRGVDDRICDGILNHYYPEKGEFPKSNWVRLYAVVDRVDYLVGTSALGLKYTSTKDPFGIRRTAGFLLSLLYESEDEFDLYEIAESSYARLSERFRCRCWRDTWESFKSVLDARASSLMKERGVPPPLQRAALPLSNRPGRVFSFLKVVSSLMERGDARLKEVLRVSERLYNILGDEEHGVPPNPEVFEEEEERALYDKLSSFDWRSVEEHRWEEYLSQLHSLVGVIDKFFDEVLVNADDPELRQNRRRLVWRALQPFSAVLSLYEVSFRDVK